MHPHTFRLIARKGETRLVYVGANKFSRHGRPVFFPTLQSALTMARWLSRNYDGLHGFKFYAVPN